MMSDKRKYVIYYYIRREYYSALLRGNETIGLDLLKYFNSNSVNNTTLNSGIIIKKTLNSEVYNLESRFGF